MTARPQLILPDNVAAVERPRAPRITIGMTSGDTVTANTAMALATMFYAMGLKRIPAALVNSKGSLPPNNRNNIIAEAQRLGSAKVLFIDSDMTFPINAIDKLLSHNVPIVGASYAQRNAPHKNLVVPKGNKPSGNVTGLVEVDKLPTGMMLIDMEVFTKLKRPYFRLDYTEEDEERGVKPMIHGEDYDFCDRARAAGYPIHVDIELSLDLIHWGEAGWRLSDELCGRSATEPDAEIIEVANPT